MRALRAVLADKRLIGECVLAYTHGYIVGNSEDGDLDCMPEWVISRIGRTAHHRRKVCDAWNDGFIHGSDVFFKTQEHG